MRLAEAAVLAVLAATQAFFGDAAADESLASPKLELAQASAAAPVPPLDALLARARSLADAGRSAAAYDLLAGAEDEYIGEIEFDYALGRAALGAGRPDRATLAFSRVLALDPSHAGALIDTGRAYLALGNFVQARAAFGALLAMDPPLPVRAQLLAYLEQAQRGQAQGTQASGLSLRGYVAATAGRSTNVNQSPGQSQVFVPAFGATFELSPQNVAIADGYWGLAGGVDVSLPLDRTYSLIGGVDLTERRNLHETDFDLGGAAARLGVSAGSETQLLRLQVLSGRSYLGREASRDVTALALDGFKALSADTQLIAFAQAGRLRYLSDALRIFDSDFTALGAGASRQLARNTIVSAGFTVGEENDLGGNASGDKRYLGLRVSAEAGILPRTKLIAGLTPQWARYDRVDPSFLVERRDFRREYDLALQYALDDRLFVRIGVVRTVQGSNIAIYEYQRTDFWVMLRRDFR